ncbi:hypothetical protein CD790_33830 [Streptomyces sp. SAJ15]|nr:hypothetical protein CD790_33830 [Streptomyces sp. SAJ15]
MRERERDVSINRSCHGHAGCLPGDRGYTRGRAAEPTDVDDVDQDLILEDLTEQVLDWRTRAAHDHQIVNDHIAWYGKRSAQRLFTRAFRRDRAAPVRPRAPGPRLLKGESGP